MDLVTAPSSLSSFGPYRRKQALAAIARELEQSRTYPAPGAAPARRIDTAGLNAAMHQLTAATDPLTVFTQLAALLVPVACDEAFAAVYSGDELARRQQRPAVAERPTGRVDRAGPGWTVTVCTAGHPAGDPGEPAESDYVESDYVAELTCSGIGEPPTPGEVALIKLAGRCAAIAVHQARQADLLAAREQQIDHLRIVLDSNRFIGAAVGVLMAQHLLTYQRAFELLTKVAQESNTKLSVAAESVVYTGCLPKTLSRTTASPEGGTAHETAPSPGIDQTCTTPLS